MAPPSVRTRPRESSATKLPPSREQLFDEGRRFLLQSHFEPVDRGERLRPHRDELGRTELDAGVEGDVSEIVHGSPISEAYFTIRRLPTGHPPVQPMLSAIGGRRDEHRGTDCEYVVFHPSKLTRPVNNTNCHRGRGPVDAVNTFQVRRLFGFEKPIVVGIRCGTLYSD